MNLNLNLCSFFIFSVIFLLHLFDTYVYFLFVVSASLLLFQCDCLPGFEIERARQRERERKRESLTIYQKSTKHVQHG